MNQQLIIEEDLDDEEGDGEGVTIETTYYANAYDRAAPHRQPDSITDEHFQDLNELIVFCKEFLRSNLEVLRVCISEYYIRDNGNNVGSDSTIVLIRRKSGPDGKETNEIEVVHQY